MKHASEGPFAAVATDDVHRHKASGQQQGPGLAPELMGDEGLRHLLV